MNPPPLDPANDEFSPPTNQGRHGWWIPRGLVLPRLDKQTAGWLALIAALTASYFTAMSQLVFRWWNEPEYSHGFVVPAFSMVLLWWRRDMIAFIPGQGSRWGLLLLGVCAVMRGASVYFYFELLDPASLVPCLLGIALLVGGWPAVRWAWPAILFLIFMIPLPGFLAGKLSLPLQSVATMAGTYVLQTAGFPAAAQGNEIMLTNAQLGVVEACSGLRMLMAFLTVCTGAAIVLKRPLWQRLLILLSAVPIALLANIVRISVTGVLYETTTSKLAEAVYHDFAGWLMMPLALGLLWLELGLIELLLERPAPRGPLSLQQAGTVGPPEPTKRKQRRAPIPPYKPRSG